MLSCWPGPLAWRSTRSVASPDPTLRPDFLRGHGGMVIGAACLAAISWAAGGIGAVAAFGGPQWGAALYLATVCGAGIYYLWSFALGAVSPTIVALTVTVNPITAAIFGAVVLGEPIHLSLVIGLLGVAAGIWVAAGLRFPALRNKQP